MSGLDETGRAILRNLLLGRWTAGKLGLTGDAAEAYAKTLAAAATGPVGSDVFSRIRADFDAAGVPVPDEQILGTMTDLAIQAGGRGRDQAGGRADGAAFAIKRNLTSR